MHACCGHTTLFHLLQEHIQVNFGWKPSHPTPAFALYNLDGFSSSHSSSLVVLPPISSILHFPWLVLQVLDAFVTLPMLCPFLPLRFTSVQQPEILFFFLQDLRCSSSCCGLRDLVQEPSTTIRTLDHLTDTQLVQLFNILPLVFLFHLSQPVIPFLLGIFPSCIEPSILSVRRQQLTHPSSAVSIHPFF